MNHSLVGNLQKIEQQKALDQMQRLIKLFESYSNRIEKISSEIEQTDDLEQKKELLESNLANLKNILETRREMFLYKVSSGVTKEWVDNINKFVGVSISQFVKSSRFIAKLLKENNKNIEDNLEESWANFLDEDGNVDTEILKSNPNYDWYLSLVEKLSDDNIKDISYLREKDYINFYPLDLSIDKDDKDKDDKDKLSNFMKSLEEGIKVVSDFIKYLEENNDRLNNQQIEYMATIINDNIKLYFYYILSNPNLPKDEKIEKIESYYRENIENNYFFPIREKVSETLGTIIAKNTIGDNLFEKLIARNDGRVSKNIRLEFIKQAEIEKILEYVEENKLGLQSTLAFLDRLKKELNQKYDDALFQKYKEYKKIFLDLYKTKNNRNNREELITYYNQEHKNSNFAISETKNKLSDNLNTEKQEKEAKTLIDKLKAKPAYREIKDELGKLENFDKNILSILFKNYPSFVLRNFLSENKGKYNKNDVINALLDTKNLLKVLSILEFIKDKNLFNIEQTNLLKTLIEKGLIKDFNDIVNIVGTSIFKDYQLEVLKNGKINKKNATLFFKLMLLSKNDKSVFQNIYFSKNITDTLDKQGYGIIDTAPNIIKLVKKNGKGKYKRILTASI